MREVLVDLKEQDIPTLWKAVVFAVEGHFAKYADGRLTFWKAPPFKEYGFEDPEDARADVGPLTPGGPFLFIVAKRTEIRCSDAKGCSEEAIRIQVTEREAGQVLTEKTLVVRGDSRERFEFADPGLLIYTARRAPSVA